MVIYGMDGCEIFHNLNALTAGSPLTRNNNYATTTNPADEIIYPSIPS